MEVFKNRLPTKLYWILFPLEDLRQAVETAKRILTKEKLDKQLTGPEANMGKEVIDPDFSKITEGTIFKKMLGDMEDKIVEKDIEMIGMMVTIEVGTEQEKGHFQGIIAIIWIEVQVIADQGQDPELAPIAAE